MQYTFKELHWNKEIPIKEYLQPRTLEEALKILLEYKGRAQIIAGGTDIIPQLRRGDLRIDVLVDITRLPDMEYLDLDGDFICIGGLVTHAQVCSSPLMRERAALLAEAAGALGSPQIRNIATIAGNLITGQPAADTALPLLALNAKVTILSEAGEREVPLTEFFLAQGQTILNSRSEILTKIRFCALGAHQGGCYLRLSKRRALSLPILALASVVTVEMGRNVIKDVAIALGPVAPIPFRASLTEARLRGLTISKRSLEIAAHSAFDEANPRHSLLRGSREYRREMVSVLVRRGLNRALERAGVKTIEEV
jgi:carbon-monoxide dehydrogenase medium subunit